MTCFHLHNIICRNSINGADVFTVVKEFKSNLWSLNWARPCARVWRFIRQNYAFIKPRRNCSAVRTRSETNGRIPVTHSSSGAALFRNLRYFSPCSQPAHRLCCCIMGSSAASSPTPPPPFTICCCCSQTVMFPAILTCYILTVPGQTDFLKPLFVARPEQM